MGILAANFRAWLKIWNGSLISASGACNSDAQPLDIKQNPHKRKIRNNFLEEFNGLFLFGVSRIIIRSNILARHFFPK